jgi:hypothetical protein
MSSIPNCAASQFFQRPDHPEMQHLPASDNSPFFYSSETQTIFATSDTEHLTFHCPSIDRAGADDYLTVSGRGNFSNPGLCTFETDFMKFIPSRPIHLDHKAADISSPFGTPNLDITKFPPKFPNFNIPKTNLTGKLRKLTNDYMTNNP